jgi:hypothetical protein
VGRASLFPIIPQQSPVHYDGGAGDVVGVRGSQKCCYTCHILGVVEPAERYVLFERIELGGVVQQPSVDRQIQE